MDEQKYRQIAREEAQKVMQENYSSGSPSVPLHVHDGVSNLPIQLSSIDGFLPLGNATAGVVKQNTIVTTTFSTSFTGPTIVYPVPIVFSGVAGGFNGGEAPDGTIILDGAGGAFHLNAMIGGEWKTVLLT